MVFLASDNTSHAHPKVMEWLAKANHGHQKSYGADEFSAQLTAELRKFFAHDELLAFPVFNGSAANCLSLASLMQPFEAVICHPHSHIANSEAGMPSFFTGGTLQFAGGENGKIDATQLEVAIKYSRSGGVHRSSARILSLTQSTEIGTIYKIEHIKQLADIAHNNNMLVHMDGARFFNALAHSKINPAEMTWQSGVDILALGATKNGAMLCEVIVCFKPDFANYLPNLQKRSGQLASKQRFIAAQMLAMLEDDLWRKNATHANDMAKLLGDNLTRLGIKPLFAVESNAIFVEIAADIVQKLHNLGYYFYDWELLGDNVYRLIAGWSTTAEEIEQFIADLNELIR
jgi:threonine aldolase